MSRTLSRPTSQPRAPKDIRESLKLDASQFQPTEDDGPVTASSLLFGSRIAFRSRNRIPPVTDKLTHTIDRSMVAQGIITPEELVEIHTIGAQMDELRPSVQTAVARATAAVQQSREAQAALKAQKKQEALERRQQHAEAVAHRRATDIIYLGRGVSTGLHDRRSNVEALQASGLPVLSTPAEVAQAMGITIPKLRWLAFHAQSTRTSNYINFQIPKKSGGMRTISAPKKNLAQCQQWIFANIFNKTNTHPAAHGFVPGRSTVSNAANHSQSKILINCDLKDFFPGITFPRIRGLFQKMGYSPAVATILALICTEPPRRKVDYAGKSFFVASGPRALPQGSCCSPAISNLIAHRLDLRLAAMAEKLGWRYSRYADDISFSTDRDDQNTMVGYILARIRHIVQDENFSINKDKTRILRPSAAQLVTGIVVNERPGVPRKQVRRIRAILHRARHEGLTAQNKHNIPNFEAWLGGMIAYITMVNPDQGLPLKKAFMELRA